MKLQMPLDYPISVVHSVTGLYCNNHTQCVGGKEGVHRIVSCPFHMSEYGTISRYSSARHKIPVFSSHPAPFKCFLPQQICLTDDATQSLSVTQTAAESVHLYLILTVSLQFIFHCL